MTMADRLPGDLQLRGPVFKIGEVARQFFDMPAEERNSPAPCVRPPFEHAWFESPWVSLPGVAPAGISVAVHMSAFKLAPGGEVAATLSRIFDAVPPTILVFHRYVERRPGVIDDCGIRVVPVDEVWAPMRGEFGECALSMSQGPRPEKPFENFDEARAAYNSNTIYCPIGHLGLEGPALLALGLLNCRNVQRKEHIPRPKLSRRCEAAYGRPAATCYTLVIDPLEPLARSAPGLAAGGTLAQPLHAVRGHFKDYREHGLFGRNRGLFWFGPQLRGSADNGVVEKDYAVAAPKMPGSGNG